VDELVPRSWRNARLTNFRLNLTLTNSAHHGAVVSYSLQQSQTEAINQGKLCCHKIQHRHQTSTAIDRQTRFQLLWNPQLRSLFFSVIRKILRLS